MGYFQERIITQDYPLCGSSSTQKGDHFQDAQFLVLANRLVALTLSGAWLAGSWRRQPAHTPPFYLHSFSSLSNIISRLSVI
jgi:hypothetical protein